jgi:hypothetical protein
MATRHVGGQTGNSFSPAIGAKRELVAREVEQLELRLEELDVEARFDIQTAHHSAIAYGTVKLI